MSRISVVKVTSPRGTESPAHRRTNSAPAPAPTIEVEDVSRPLTSIENVDEEDDPIVPPLSRSRTSGVHGAYRGRHVHARKPSPNVAWRKKWNYEHDPFKDGRVLVVDLLSRDQSADKKRQTQAHELTTLKELSAFYKKETEKKIAPCLRIIHVQNSIWARDFLFKKYGISNPESPELDKAGNAFSKWAMFEKPQQRAGRPVLNAKAFALDKSPLRNIWRTGFGVDYLRYFTPGHMNAREEAMGEENSADAYKLLEINKWIEGEGLNSYPAHGYDVYVQRLSVYVQRNMESAGLINEDWRSVAGTYAPRDSEEIDRTERILHDEEAELETATREISSWEDYQKKFDNGTTVIVFESSHSGLVRDTLIEARAEIEKKWRQIFTDLPRDDIETDSLLALECLDFSINYIIQALIGSWEKFLAKCEEHVDILEEKIYESPADESRAPELWSNQNIWLKIEKLQFVQMETVSALRKYLREIAMGDREFLKETPEQFKRIETLIDEELTKPTANLNDLVYKSVAIRDSRQEIQLGTSMWRLSWITFVFLPLTFISGFFGMNVDIFQPPGNEYPSIKWYFVGAVPLMIFVVIGYYLLKRTLSSRHDETLRRGTFEDIYYQFAQEHPQLWSRTGPRSYVHPRGPFSRVKWFLVCYWFAPTRTISAEPRFGINDMSVIARMKHILARRWLKSIKVAPSDGLSAAERGESNGDFGIVMQLLDRAIPVAMADGEPQAAIDLIHPHSRSQRNITRQRASSNGSTSSPQLGGRGGSYRRGFFRSTSPASRSGRSGSPGSDGMVCEEEESGPFEAQGGLSTRDEKESMEGTEQRMVQQEPVAFEGSSALLAIPAENRQVTSRRAE